MLLDFEQWLKSDRTFPVAAARKGFGYEKCSLPNEDIEHCHGLMVQQRKKVSDLRYK